jgi:replication factor C small subunit
MEKIDNKNFIWAEKYRPQTTNDLIFPTKQKEIIKSWLENEEIPNIGLFGSTPGTGKTSLANALIKELNADVLWINASKDNGIDTIRAKVTQFASTVSVMGKIKIVVYDEADYLTPNAQATLRSDLETFSKNCRFIFTGNYPDKIIEPLLNRLQIFDLDKMYQDYKADLGKQIYYRLKFILENENIEYQTKDIQEIIKNFYPSLREMVMFIQHNNASGKLLMEQMANSNTLNLQIVEALKEKQFNTVRSLINNIAVPDIMYSYIWKNLDNFFFPESQPALIILLAKYQDMNIRAKNKLITLMAFFTEVMQNQQIKIKDFK